MAIISDFVPSGVSPVATTPKDRPVVGSLWTKITTTGQFVENWYWNGTYWLSVQKYTTTVNIEAAVSINLPLPILFDSNLFLTSFVVAYRTNGNNNDATRYWNVQLQRVTISNSITGYDFISTQSQAPNVYFNTKTTLNLHLNVATTATKALIVNVERIGNPSPLRFNFLLNYQKAEI